MADVIRLSIVYETSQVVAGANRASAALSQVGNVSQKSSRHLRSMALAGTHLAHGMASGNLSVMGLARSMSHLAGAGVAGAVLVSIINVINAFHEFKRITEDVTNTIDAMQTAARDAKNDVARLLGEAPAESNAEKAIKRLRDAARQLRKEGERLGGPAGRLLAGQADELEAQIPGVGRRAAGQGGRERAKEAADATRDYNKQLRDLSSVLGFLNAGPMEQLQAHAALLRKRFEDLVKSGAATSEQLETMGLALQSADARLQKMKDRAAEAERKWDQMADTMGAGLDVMGNALEDFVMTGTFAFEQFINSLLQTMVRSGITALIGDLMPTKPKTFQSGGIVPGMGPQLAVVHGGEEIIPRHQRAGPSLTTQVSFTVTALDAQGVSQFFQQHGAEIAGVVAKQADRSRQLRRKWARG